VKNKPLFDKTLNILVKAYLNNTLQHGHCRVCAVGNLIAANCGYKFTNASVAVLDWENGISRWGNVFYTYDGKQLQDLSKYRGEAKKQIDSTGYSVKELSRIEFAFETAPKGNSDEEWMYTGLMAVLSVLQEIHEVSKEEAAKAKALFVKL